MAPFGTLFHQRHYERALEALCTKKSTKVRLGFDTEHDLLKAIVSEIGLAAVREGETEPFEYHHLIIAEHLKSTPVPLNPKFGSSKVFKTHSDMLAALNQILIGYQNNYECVIIAGFDIQNDWTALHTVCGWILPSSLEPDVVDVQCLAKIGMLPNSTRTWQLVDVSAALGVYDVTPHNAAHDAHLTVKSLVAQEALLNKSITRASPALDDRLPVLPGSKKQSKCNNKRKQPQPPSPALPSNPTLQLPSSLPSIPQQPSLQQQQSPNLTPQPPSSLSPPRKKLKTSSERDEQEETMRQSPQPSLASQRIQLLTLEPNTTPSTTPSISTSTTPDLCDQTPRLPGDHITQAALVTQGTSNDSTTVNKLIEALQSQTQAASETFSAMFERMAQETQASRETFTAIFEKMADERKENREEMARQSQRSEEIAAATCERMAGLAEAAMSLSIRQQVEDEPAGQGAEDEDAQGQKGGGKKGWGHWRLRDRETKEAKKGK